MPEWRHGWLPGMKVEAVFACDNYRLSDTPHPSHPGEYDWPHDLGLRWPDTCDPATVGCLFELAERKATRAIEIIIDWESEPTVLWMHIDGARVEGLHAQMRGDLLVAYLEGFE